MSETSHDDDGLTLIEVLISVALLVVIIASISGALIVFLKNGPDALGRDDHSAGAALTASYIDRDVASTEEIPVTSACALPAGGQKVVALRWWDYRTPNNNADEEVEPVRTTQYDRVYAVAPDPTPATPSVPSFQLVRVACGGPASSQGTTTLLTDLPSTSSVTYTAGTCGPLAKVTLAVLAFQDDASENYTFSGCAKTRLTP